MYTEAINHGPGVTFMQSGSQFPGRPSMGAWLDYGLGTLNNDLPSFVVMVTKGNGGQPLVSSMLLGFNCTTPQFTLIAKKYDGCTVQKEKTQAVVLP